MTTDQKGPFIVNSKMKKHQPIGSPVNVTKLGGKLRETEIRLGRLTGV